MEVQLSTFAAVIRSVTAVIDDGCLKRKTCWLAEGKNLPVFQKRSNFPSRAGILAKGMLAGNPFRQAARDFQPDSQPHLPWGEQMLSRVEVG